MSACILSIPLGLLHFMAASVWSEEEKCLLITVTEMIILRWIFWNKRANHITNTFTYSK